MEEFGETLRCRRKQLRFTQAFMAEWMGCSERLIREMEQGRGTVGFEKMFAYANLLGMDFVLRLRD